MTLSPDTTGFFAASRTLRAELGTLCTFHLPQAPTWPPGTRINPDTGEPYSAMAVRSNAEYVDVVATVLVILKQGSPLRPQADTHWEEVGLMSGMDIILDVDSNDYPTVQDAAKFTINALTYKVEEWKPFALANTVYRYLAYGMED